jgi:hypothetical protein
VKGVKMPESFYSNVHNAPVSKTDIVRSIPAGKDNAVPVSWIAKRLGISDGGTEPAIRKIILEAIDEGDLIASCSKGYFQIETYVEFDEYLESLNSRILGIQRRMSRLRINWQAKGEPIQGRLFK